MRYGYIDKINSAKEFQEYVRLFEQNGVALDDVIINPDFENLTSALTEGDELIVCSYIGLFASLGSYLTTATELLEKGIVIESLLEPGVCVNISNREFARELNILNHRLRSSSSLKSMDKLKTEGKKIGRPRGSSSELQKKVTQIEKLRK